MKNSFFGVAAVGLGLMVSTLLEPGLAVLWLSFLASTPHAGNPQSTRNDAKLIEAQPPDTLLKSERELKLSTFAGQRGCA